MMFIAIDFQLQLNGISDCDNWKVDKTYCVFLYWSDQYKYFTLGCIVAMWLFLVLLL